MYAVIPVPIANVPADPSLKCCGATTRIRIPNPRTCSAAITAAIAPARCHSDRVIEPLTRLKKDARGNDTDEASITLSSHQRNLKPRALAGGMSLPATRWLIATSW